MGEIINLASPWIHFAGGGVSFAANMRLNLPLFLLQFYILILIQSDYVRGI